MIYDNSALAVEQCHTNYEFIISTEWYIVSYVTSDKGYIVAVTRRQACRTHPRAWLGGAERHGAKAKQKQKNMVIPTVYVASVVNGCLFEECWSWWVEIRIWSFLIRPKWRLNVILTRRISNHDLSIVMCCSCVHRIWKF